MKGMAILLVDDEPLMRLSMVDALEAVGYDVHAAASGTEGLEMLRQKAFDLVITDLRLPGADGLTVLKATKDNEYYRKVLGQLAFYAIAIKASKEGKLGRWPVRAGLLQPMCATPDLMVDIMAGGGQAIREMATRIERVAGDIWAGRLDPKPNDWCPRCEVKHACPLFAVPASGQLLLTA